MNWTRYLLLNTTGGKLCYQPRKKTAFELAQTLANSTGMRVKVYDTNYNAKFWWEFIPSSEGAQGVRIHKL